MSQQRSVVVAVVPGQSDAVVLEAATYAAYFDAELVCAYVDTHRFVTAEHADGTVESLPIDLDPPTRTIEEVTEDLLAHMREVLPSSTIAWSIRVLAGHPDRALGALAHTLNAALIVIGGRRVNVVHEAIRLVTGSLADRLTQQQRCPVLVIPQPPNVFGNPPWMHE